MKKVLASLLCLLMVFTLMPGMALAEEGGGSEEGPQNSPAPLYWKAASDVNEGELKVLPHSYQELEEAGWSYSIEAALGEFQGYFVYLDENDVPQVVTSNSQIACEIDNTNIAEVTLGENGISTIKVKAKAFCSIHVQENGKDTIYEFVIINKDDQGGSETGGDNREIAPVDPNVNYDLTLEMLVDPEEFEGYIGSNDHMEVNGQGNGLLFNEKITKWYTCFFVRNRNTQYDARYVVKPDIQEIRTYIGGENDFVIMACQKGADQGEWVSIDRIPEEYRIFSLEYKGQVKNFSPVFQVTYNYEKDMANKATEKYEYMLLYDGEDEYLNNGKEGNRFEINLMADEELVEFDLDEQIYDEKTGRYNQGNVMHFDFIGTTLRAKLVIRPGVLKSVADKKLYDDDDKIFIENEAKNIVFYRLGDYEKGKGPQGAVALDENTSPFSVTWDAKKSEYVITYDHPERDMYGPHYMMRYVGDIDGKINNRFKYASDKKNRVGNNTSVITGKLTQSVETLPDDGTINADAEEYVNTTEILFIRGSLTGGQATITIITNGGKIVLHGDLVKNMEKVEKIVSFFMRDIKTEQYELSAALKDAVESSVKTFDFRIFSENGEVKSDISFGDEGYAEITIPCETEDPSVYYINENGEKEFVDCIYKDGFVTFIAKHFSAYSIMDGSEGVSLKDAEIAEIADQEYTGNEIKPTLTVTYNGIKLVEGTDFTVTYSDNAEPGTATATITGIGTYTGGQTINFKITKKDGDDTPAPGSGGYIPTAPAVDSLEKVKAEAAGGVEGYVTAAEYEEEEAALIKSIIEQAKKDIAAAKSKEEVNAIEAKAKEELDKLETAAEKAEIRAIENTRFRAKSKLITLKGKKAVKITWNKPANMEFDGYDVFRSLKRYKGYGKKPFFTTTKQSYINTKDLKKGTRYFYKVRGFKYVNDEKVYTDWSTKAWRTVK